MGTVRIRSGADRYVSTGLAALAFGVLQLLQWPIPPLGALAFVFGTEALSLLRFVSRWHRTPST